MRTTLIIENGVVVNIIAASALEAEAVYPASVCIDEFPDHVGIGYYYDGNAFTPPADSEVPEPTQFEKDQSRYQKRAAVKDELMAYMAADNMRRVRLGVENGGWSVADLTALLDDPAVVAANALMGTLSFELAAQQIQAATTPLLTAEIKADWTSRLEEHYYLEG